MRKIVNGISIGLIAFVSDRNHYFHPLITNKAYVSTRGTKPQLTVAHEDVIVHAEATTMMSADRAYASENFMRGLLELAFEP